MNANMSARHADSSKTCSPDVHAEVERILMRIKGDPVAKSTLADRLAEGIQNGGNEAADVIDFAYFLETICTDGELVAL